VAVLHDEFELLEDRPGVDPDAIDWELNEWDEFSLEAALRLREAEGSGEVVVISVGEVGAEESLRACLARGADHAQRVWKDGLEGADPLTVARVLPAALELESPDLVLCGVQSGDAVNSATGVALAAHLGLPRVAVVKALSYDGDLRAATVERELEGGLVELLRVELPALLTIQTGINEPRYANLRAIKQAKDQPVEVMAPGELGLDEEVLAAAAGSRVRSRAMPSRISRISSMVKVISAPDFPEKEVFFVRRHPAVSCGRAVGCRPSPSASDRTPRLWRSLASP
jgi:electron transfer flavoprotein beta subunit